MQSFYYKIPVLPIWGAEDGLQGYQNPLLVLHTRHDGLVDLSHAQRNYEWAASTQKKLHIFERGDHNSLLFVNQHAYHQALADFLDQLRSP